MKKWILVLTAVMISLSAISQGIEFQKESYADMLKIAKKQKKLVFIDIYTSWCGPCQHMSKNIFPQPEAGRFFNAHFLNLKLDAEKSEDGKMVAKKFGVSAYPTFLFINGEGELVYRFLGGRTVDMLVKEGEKAVEAYAARPELKKYMKKYEEGNRNKEFLDQYYMLKDRSGLDCSDVLKDYFALVSDEQLLDSVNIPRISKIAVYDANLTKRLVDAVCKEAARTDKDKKQFTVANKAVCALLGACLKDVANGGNETAFEEVLALKERLFAAAGNHDSATAASLGGGNIYIPSDLSRLSYYAAKKKPEQFMKTFRSYIAAVQKKYESTREEKQAMQQAMDAKLKAAKEGGNEEEYKTIKKMSAMMSAFSSIDDYYISTNLIENVEKYENFYTGVKNDAFKTQIAGWYVFLHEFSPSVKTAVYVADKLVEMGKKQEAAEVLALGIDKGAKAPGVEESDVEKCKTKLKELKDNQENPKTEI